MSAIPAPLVDSIHGDPIPPGHHALKYAERVKLPAEFVELAWDYFAKSYADSKKQYNKDSLSLMNLHSRTVPSIKATFLMK